MSNKPEIIEIEDVINKSYRKFKPIITNLCCFLCICLFIGINLESKQYDWDTYAKWGAPSVIDLFSGKYWGLITSNFLHVEWWHILFNLCWFWLFGKKIEFEEGKGYYLLLMLSSALVSSLAQLVFSSNTGIGLSGIVYGFFGYLLVKEKTSEDYRGFIDKNTMKLFVFWLFICVLLSMTDSVNIGNAAHFGGFLWGMMFAYITRFRKFVQWLIGIDVLLLLVSMILWWPFSVSYLSYKAYTLHTQEKIDEAMVVYEKIIERDEDSQWARDNLKILEIYKLNTIAFDHYKNAKYEEARQVYNKVLEIDPQNQRAKEGLSYLPDAVISTESGE